MPHAACAITAFYPPYRMMPGLTPQPLRVHAPPQGSTKAISPGKWDRCSAGTGSLSLRWPGLVLATRSPSVWPLLCNLGSSTVPGPGQESIRSGIVGGFGARPR